MLFKNSTISSERYKRTFIASKNCIELLMSLASGCFGSLYLYLPSLCRNNSYVITVVTALTLVFIYLVYSLQATTCMNSHSFLCQCAMRCRLGHNLFILLM